MMSGEVFAYIGRIHNLKDLKDVQSALEGRTLEVFCCAPKGSRALPRIPRKGCSPVSG